MTKRAFEAMQAAVDIVNDSPHPTHKISSAVFNDEFIVTATNYWPEPIADKVGTKTRIGGSSGTVHAETTAILKAEKTEGTSICITDPFCPNCAKNIAEAGIKNIYIDHKGFEKAFWEKSGDHFENMSMEIATKAGINVFEINRKAQKITPIYETPEGYTPPEDSPIIIEPCINSKEEFIKLVHDMDQLHHNHKFVTAMVTTEDGESFCMTVRVHAVIGHTIESDHDIETMTNPGQKYTYIQEPVNRLLMTAKRKGYKIHPKHIFCSQIPTAREQVNMIGAGIQNIMLGAPFRSRHPEDKDAKDLLQKHKALHFEDFSGITAV